MDKLEYDSLYKFLVSLGIVLMVLPFAALVYLFNGEPILISQIEFDALSEYSLSLIDNRNELTNWFVTYFHIVGGIMFSLGFCLAAVGLFKWNQNQKKLDKLLESDVTEKRLTLLEMTNKEVDAKVEQEVKEAADEDEVSKEISDTTPVTQTEAHYSAMAQYREIEDYCFKYFVVKYGKTYNFKRNIRMGKFDYDIIGVSQKDNVDLLVEIKYWKNPGVVARGLIDTCTRFEAAQKNYETITSRNHSGLVFIVVPDKAVNKFNDTIARCMQKTHESEYSGITIECVAESIIK